MTFCHNWPFNPSLCFLLGQLQSHDNSFPLSLWPLSSLRRILSLTFLKTFWVSKCTISTKSPSSTIFLTRSLSRDPSVRPFFPASCWVCALLSWAISLKLHYPAFKQKFRLISPGHMQGGMTCKSSNLTLRLFEVTFPVSQSLLLFLSKSIKSYLNCLKMPAQTIQTSRKGLLRQVVDVCSSWLGFSLTVCSQVYRADTLTCPLHVLLTPKLKLQSLSSRETHM